MRIKNIFVCGLMLALTSCVVQPMSAVEPNTPTYVECVWPANGTVNIWPIENLPIAFPEIFHEYQRGFIRFRTDYRVPSNDDSMIHLSLDGAVQRRGGNTRHLGMGTVQRSEDQSACSNRTRCTVYEAPVFFWYNPDASGSGSSVVEGRTLISGRSLRARINICAEGSCLLGEERVVQVEIVTP